jgi:GNAT superfamily N-acetyltransferase
MLKEVKFKTGKPGEFADDEKEIFKDLLIKQKKVRNPTVQKINACFWLCLCFEGGAIVSIGAIKPSTKFDFDKNHADLEALQNEFKVEIGYCYTEPEYGGKGYSSQIVKLLLEKCGPVNVMASTELRSDNRMKAILEKSGFKFYGRPWKSAIHSGLLGLYLRIVK